MPGPDIARTNIGVLATPLWPIGNRQERAHAGRACVCGGGTWSWANTDTAQGDRGSEATERTSEESPRHISCGTEYSIATSAIRVRSAPKIPRWALTNFEVSSTGPMHGPNPAAVAVAAGSS